MAVLAATLAAAASTSAQGPARAATDSLGKTTVQQTVQPAGAGAFRNLTTGPGWSRVVRVGRAAASIPQRGERRRSLAYFAQLTDFQLADEESPARVEFTDSDPSGLAAAAQRPQEALQPFGIDYSLRQVNRFVAASPVPQARGARARMAFGLLTGDNSDNMQFNESLWVRQLVEGAQPLSPNSGVKTPGYPSCSPDARAALAAKEAAGQLPDEPIYTGVQDYGDYPASTDFYDPNSPQGKWAAFPRYPGLLDRAEQPFVPEGLHVPTYLANGNHDGLVQGNEDATAAIEAIATGCFKPITGLTPGLSDPNKLLSVGTGFFVRPDPGRQFIDRVELKRIFRGGRQGDGHGFNFVDKGQLAASGFAASYYAWDPKPGVRFIALDTVSEGGVVGVSSDGNIDDPQFKWLEAELKRATAQDELVVVYGHHPVRSLTSTVTDETASACTGRYASEGNTYSGVRDAHGTHDVNPGCDLDPRDSSPIHTGADFSRLLSRYPHVVAYVSGHTHENKLLPCGQAGGCPGPGAWWEINTAAIADWPQQQRLVEIMDNRDGTLSLFGTLTNHGGRLDLPGSGSGAGGFDGQTLAGIDLTLSYNDPAANRGAQGAAADRNVELLLRDPRRSSSLAGLLRRCSIPTGKVRRSSIDRAKLGRTKSRIRKRFRRRSLRRRRHMDRFCLAGGGALRVGYKKSRPRRGRAVLLLASSKLYRVRRVRAGVRTRTLKRRVKRLRSTRIGKNRWYWKRARGATLVFKVRRGKVREVGLADRRLARNRAATRRLLKGYRL